MNLEELWQSTDSVSSKGQVQRTVQKGGQLKHTINVYRTSDAHS